MADCGDSAQFMNPSFLTDFIEAYREFPCLWKVKSDEYRDRNKRDEALNNLLRSLLFFLAKPPNSSNTTIAAAIFEELIPTAGMKLESSETASFGELKAIKQVITVSQLNPEATGALILLHGTGDDAKCFSRSINDLMGMKAVFPHIRIIYPSSPLTRYTPALGLQMRTWFDISNYTMDAVEDEHVIKRVGSDLLRIIDSQVEYGIPRNRIAVGGFSRGGAMAFHLGYDLAPDIAAVGVMSSWIPYSSVIYKHLRERGPSQKLPILLQQHGDIDQLVNIKEGRTTFEEMRKLGVQGKFVSLAGQSHEVSTVGLQDFFRFVSELIPENHRV